MKNDIIQIEITDITPEGFGVGRNGGKVVFVADTAVGDVITAKILKETKSHSFGKALEVLTPSPCRIDSNVPFRQNAAAVVFFIFPTRRN